MKRRRKNRTLLRNLSIAVAAMVILFAVLLVVAIRKPEKEEPASNDSRAVSQIEEAASSPTEAGRETESAAGDPGTASGEADETGETEEAQESEDSQEETAPPVETIVLTEEQKHTGDLILVNSQYAYDFNANASQILVNVKEAQNYDYPVAKQEFQVDARIMPLLDVMIRDCDVAMGSTDTAIESAYRSLEYQQNVWNEISAANGEEYARQYVAVPGYSEHHTGLAVDLGIIYDDGHEGSFSESQNAQWMIENSFAYGFIQRYQADKVDITGISNEAWHFRYVGIPHAVFMKTQNMCLEEYLDYLRNSTSEEAPLLVELAEGVYRIYYTENMEMKKPETQFDVSGDNAYGYIITVHPAA